MDDQLTTVLLIVLMTVLCLAVMVRLRLFFLTLNIKMKERRDLLSRNEELKRLKLHVVYESRHPSKLLFMGGKVVYDFYGVLCVNQNMEIRIGYKSTEPLFLHGTMAKDAMCTVYGSHGARLQIKKKDNDGPMSVVRHALDTLKDEYMD